MSKSKQKWHKKAQRDNWKSKFKVKVEKVVFYDESDDYIIFSGDVVSHKSEYLNRNPNLRPIFKGYVNTLIKEGELIECTGRGRIGDKSRKYEVSFIDLKYSLVNEVLVEVIEILRKPTGAVEESNGAIRYYVRYGDDNATYSQSVKYEGIINSLKKVKRDRLSENDGGFILKELHMKDKSNTPIVLAKKYWEYRPLKDIENDDKYIKSSGREVYKIIESYIN